MCTQSFTETGRDAQSFEGTGPPTPKGNDCGKWPVRIAIYRGGRIGPSNARHVDGADRALAIQRTGLSGGRVSERTGIGADGRTGGRGDRGGRGSPG